MRVLEQLRMYSRFARGLRSFLRETVTPDQARERIARRLAGRTGAFLRMLELGWTGAPRSPYRALMSAAGCGPGDVRSMVLERGIEATLAALKDAGVYFTFEEYKGRQPVVRNGREIPVEPSSFDNPYLTKSYENSTSGSTGAGTRVSTDLDLLAVGAEHRLAFLAAHDLHDVPLGIWRPPLPGSGLNVVLRSARAGRPVARWFAPVVSSDLRPDLRFRLANQATIALGRAFGANLPWPEKVSVNDAGIIARWMAESRDRSGGVVMATTVSGGLRVALAARAAGIDMTGTTFMLAGEPATPAKLQGIEASGARHITDYGMADAGRVAVGCARPLDGTDVHVLLDSVAITSHPRLIPQSGETVDSFYLTSFLPASPRLLLNVEFDDCGVVERRACGCALGELGLDLHLRDIHSFGKLVTEGVALPGSDFMKILEEDLPREFGGSALDYQLVEEDDESGFTRLTLVVHPRLGGIDSDRIVQVVMDRLRKDSTASDVARAFWQTAGTLRVRREEPFVSRRGKQPSVRRVRASVGASK